MSQDTAEPTAITVDNHLDADYFERTLRADVIDGLTAEHKELPPKWFYDDVGSELFEQITRLEEYYPTEAERRILRTNAATIAQESGADTLVELGSGAADKTRVLLDAMRDAGQLTRFVPFDVSEGILRSSSQTLLGEYPGLEIHGIVGDFEQHLTTIPQVGRRMVALLGGTVGNFPPTSRKALFTDIVSTMRSGDTLLLGTDLVKDRQRMVIAYDDPQGITAAFNKNILSVLNKRLNATFDLDNFKHEATFDESNEWMDLGLRSLVDHDVTIADLDLSVHFAKGEYMRTEVSAKFRPEALEAELAAVGLTMSHLFSDDNGDYAVTLSTY